MAERVSRGAARSLAARVGGVVALLLGVAGTLLAAVAVVLLAWSGVRAGNTVDGLVDDITSATSRLETRLGEAADAVTTRGSDLEARLDGLTDVASTARLSVDTVEDHPLYGVLPSRFSDIREQVVEVEEQLTRLPSLAGEGLAESIADLQQPVSRFEEGVADAGDSLRGWIRFAMLVGVLLGLWMLWGQVALARLGWRSMRRTSSQAPSPPSSGPN